MKITLYELLGLVKDGQAPKRIKWNDKIYIYSGDDYSVNNEREEWLFSEPYDIKKMWLAEFCNSEVEILDNEEKEKPLTKKDVEALGYACGEIKKCFENGWNKSLNNKPFEEDKKIEKIGNDYYHKTQPEQNQIFQRKINEIIDILKKGNKNE
jgi:hypothetical protein